MEILELSSAFQARCHAQNLASGTLAWYGQILRDLTLNMRHAAVGNVENITTGHLREYLSHLRTRGQSSETTFRTWGALRCVFRFLVTESILIQNPMDRIPKPRRERRVIRPLNMAQVRDILGQIDISTPQGLRDKALILLMLDSGLRISEALTLRLDSIYWEERLVTVLGKGRKERTIPIGTMTHQAMKDYLAVRGPGGETFFLNRTGKMLQSRCVQIAIKEYGRRASITGVRMSPHTLRHSFAIQYIRNGGDSFSLQLILGHSTLEMVRNYVNLARQDIAEQHRKFSPMDRLFNCAPQPASPSNALIPAAAAIVSP